MNDEAALPIAGWETIVSILSWPDWAVEAGLTERTAVAALALLLGVSLILATALWRRARRRAVLALAKGVELATRNAALDGLIESLPGGYWRRCADGREFCSDGLAARLGVTPGELQGFEQLAACFDASDFTVLSAKAAALRAAGAAFAVRVNSADGSMTYEAHGVSLGADAGGGEAIWFHDITKDTERAARSAARLAAMERQATRLQRVLDQAFFPAWERDAGLRIVWCNAAYAGIVGAESPEDAVARELEIETPLIPGQARELARAAATIGAPQTEIRHFVVDGQRRSLEIVEMPGLSKGHVVGFVRDVTDLDESRAELRRHVEAHAEVLNNLNTAIAIFSAEKRLYFFNGAYARLWRLDEDWLASGPTHAELLDAVRDNRLLPEQADYPAHKAAVLALYHNLIETHDSPLYLPNGSVLRQIIAPHPFGGLILLYEDVTDRLTTERLYNTLIAVQRETLNNLYEAVALYGGDGRLKLYNSAFVKLWQLDDKLLQAEPHVSDIVDMTRELFHDHGDWPRIREDLIAKVTDRIASGGRMERPDGLVIDFAGVPLPDGNMLYTYLDVTDSARIERALRERNDALEMADRLQSEFIANVSYELRTPLNVIMGFAEILSHEYFGALNERQKEYSDGILDSSQQLLALINDILDLASIEAGQLEFEPEVFDLHVTLASVLALTREQARKQKLYIAFDCPADIGEIEADERRIKQAVFNLLNNAVKYTPANGRITLGAKRRGDEVVFWVEDNGIGISEAEQQMVFGKFQRGRNTGRNRGVGLGLALVKSFIELHGGRVELISKEQIGTRVSCYLPRRQRAERPDASRKAGTA